MLWLLTILLLLYLFYKKRTDYIDTFQVSAIIITFFILMFFTVVIYIAIGESIYDTSEVKLKYSQEFVLKDTSNIQINNLTLYKYYNNKNKFFKNGNIKNINYELHYIEKSNSTNLIRVYTLDNYKIVNSNGVSSNKAILYVYENYVVYKYLIWPIKTEAFVYTSGILKVSPDTEINIIDLK